MRIRRIASFNGAFFSGSSYLFHFLKVIVKIILGLFLNFVTTGQKRNASVKGLPNHQYFHERMIDSLISFPTNYQVRSRIL